MNRTTFFKLFELLADQPDAVAKMRQLVLALGLQGRLVPQDQKESAPKVPETDLGLGDAEENGSAQNGEEAELTKLPSNGRRCVFPKFAETGAETPNSLKANSTTGRAMAAFRVSAHLDQMFGATIGNLKVRP